MVLSTEYGLKEDALLIGVGVPFYGGLSLKYGRYCTKIFFGLWEMRIRLNAGVIIRF